MKARDVTQSLMHFWRTATPRNDNLDSYVRDEVARGTMTRAVALAERRRQLTRHAEAGLVEYRIFGEVLSRDAMVLDLLPHAGQVSLESAWRQLGAVGNRTGFAAQLSRLDEHNEDVHVRTSRWIAERCILTRIDNGTATWQRWWVVPPIQRGVSTLTRCWAAYAGGVCNGTADPGGWVAALGDVCLASTPNRFDSTVQDSNLFPLLLLLLPVARQGHVEAAAIYVIARHLGSLNSDALAAREGFVPAANPERDVSAVENYNTEQAILSELLALFDRYFASYSVETYVLYAIGSLPLVLGALLWWLSNEILGVALQLALGLFGAPADPLAF